MDQNTILALYELFKQSGGVSIDTRSINKGELFLALSGPNFNANQFASQAIEQGATCAIVDDPEVVENDQFFLVENTLLSLQLLAKHHRNQFEIPVLGITGSNGKTTTKELINTVLSVRYNTHFTKGNFNNHIGVPLTLLGIASETEISLIEMGANHVGEIADLCKLAQPTHGMITNIGNAHIEGFGSYEGVLRGKSELYDYLLNHEGTVMINSTDEVLKNMGKRFPNPLFYPEKGDYYHCHLISSDPFVVLETEEGHKVETKLVGEHNFYNLAAALAWGKFFDVDPLVTAEVLANYQPGENRSEIINKGGNTIYLDAYNANPNSMQMALKTFKKMDGDKILVLGDMNELGSVSEKEHVKLIEATLDPDFELVVLCGPLMKNAASTNPNAHWFPDHQAVTNFLQTQHLKDKLILIKASRSIALENVLQSFD